MAVTKATDFDTVDVDELRSGRYILSKEAYNACLLAVLVLLERTRILAYSAHHLEEDLVAGEWAYHWASKIFSLENELTVKVFCGGGASGGDWQLYKLDPSTGAGTLVDSKNSPAGSPASATFTLSASDLTEDGYASFQIRGHASAKQTGPFFGFVMYEEPAAIVTGSRYDTLSFREDGGVWLPDSSLYGVDRQMGRIRLKMLLDIVQAALSDRNPGCAVVWPRSYQPIVGSMFWRAYGPLKMMVPIHCSKAEVAITTRGDTTKNVYMGAFSSDIKRSFNDTFVYEEAYTEVISESDPEDGGVTVFTDIDVVSGKVNNFWLLFRSERISDDVPDGYAAFQWESMSLGVGKFHTSGSGSAPAMYRDTVSPFQLHPTPPYGYHVELRFLDDAGDEYFDSTASDWAGYETARDEFGLGEDGGLIFDYGLIKHVLDGDGGVQVALSPAPNFAYPFLSSGGDKQGGEPTVYASLYRHAYQYLCSAWVGAEYDAGDGALGQGAVRARGLPSASLLRSAIVSLNNVADNGLITPMMGMQVGRSMFDMISTDVSYVFNPTTWTWTVPTTNNDVVWSDGNWRWSHLLTSKYEEPEESSTYSRVPWRKVSSGVLVIPNGRTDTKRRESILRVNIDWLAAIISTRDDPFTGQKLKLQFAVVLSENPTLNSWLETYNVEDEALLFYSEEVDLEGRIIKAKDIQTHTEWAALTPLTTAGRATNHITPDDTQQGHGLQAATTQSYGWPEELLEDRYPFQTHEMSVDITDWLDDGAAPDEVFIHVFVDFRTFEEDGAGDYTELITRKRLDGGIVTAGVCATATKLEEA